MNTQMTKTATNRSRKLLMYAVCLLALILTAASCASEPENTTSQRLDAIIHCMPTDEPLLYSCVITLTDKESGQPVDDAEFTIGADMPSMAGAHNVLVPDITPLDEPGQYGADVQLEMFGEWALSLNIEKPSRDKIVELITFTDSDGEMDEHQHHGGNE